MEPISTFTVVSWICVHFVALAIAWATRLASGSRMETLAQLGCFIAMIGVAATGFLCCQLELGLSVPSGVTLMGMVLVVVLDFRPTHEPVGRLHH